MKNVTTTPANYYKKLSILAFALLLLLVLIQVNWLYKATLLQKEQVHTALEKLVPEIALDINSIDHNMFHDTLLNLDRLDLIQLEQRIDSMLELHELPSGIPFALYQDTIEGVFKSSSPSYKEELQNSDIKACMTCIVSFAIVKDTVGLGLKSEKDYRDKLMNRSEFQYYSPISKLKSPSGKTLWFALHLPNELSVALKSMVFMFLFSLALLLLLLGLFFHVLRSLSRHKQLSQVKTDFFNNMSHEFKTPLSSIRLASKVLQKSTDLAKNQTYHQLIEKESLLLEHQIDKLLELSLLDNEELRFEYQELDLHELLQEIPKRLSPLIEKKKAHLELELNLANSSLKGDFTHLSNSFCNLVENSLKYSDQKVYIRVSTYEEAGKSVISIQDNGPGIKTEYQDHIFERFFRGRKNNQYKGKGFGIGLSYVKSIIEAHGGQIALNKAYTKGSEFIIKL